MSTLPTPLVSVATLASQLGHPDLVILDASMKPVGSAAAPSTAPSVWLPGARVFDFDTRISNAFNVPWNAVQTQGHVRSPAELRTLFAEKFGNRARLIFSCGSGVTACTLALAAELAGRSNNAVYDGSWSEWGLPSSRPVVTE